MHCLLFSDTNFQKFHDTDIYLHCIHNENQLFDAIQSFNPLLIIIGSEKLSVLSVETLDLLLTQKHLVLLADFICSELFPLLSTLSFDRIVPWEEIHSTPQLFVSSIATTAMNQILAESNDIFKYIIDSGDSKTPAAATLSTVLQKIDIHSLYVLFFCASSPFTSQHFDVINNFSARNEIWRFAPIWINGEITLLFPHQQKPLLHELIDAFNEIDHDLEYSIGVSRHLFLSEYPDFFQAFQEAKLATMINFYRKQEISTYFESMFMLDYNYVALIHSEKEITNAILSGYSEEKLYLAIDRYIDCFKEQSLLPQLVYESVYRLFNTLDRMLKFIDPICTINLENLTIHDFEQYGTIDKLHQALCDKLSFILKKGENYTQLNTHTLRDIKRYLDDHLDQSISLDRIEQQFYINKYVFCRQFKKLTGQTFGNYLKLQRLYKARDMLENSNMRIYEIAVHLGFKNESYFSSVFKKYFKYSPTEYRTAHCTPDSYGMS